MESRQAKEAMIAMKSAQAGQTLNATRSTPGEQNMQVELRGTASAPANKMTLAKDCPVYEKADTKSKLLGKKKAGSSFTAKADANWVSFQLKDQRTVFVPKNGFN